MQQDDKIVELARKSGIDRDKPAADRPAIDVGVVPVRHRPVAGAQRVEVSGAGMPRSPPRATASPGGAAAVISSIGGAPRVAVRDVQPSMRAIVCSIRCAGGFSSQYKKISPASASVIP